jgi:hypothetical protein
MVNKESKKQICNIPCKNDQGITEKCDGNDQSQIFVYSSACNMAVSVWGVEGHKTESWPSFPTHELTPLVQEGRRMTLQYCRFREFRLFQDLLIS